MSTSVELLIQSIESSYRSAFAASEGDSPVLAVQLARCVLQRLEVLAAVPRGDLPQHFDRVAFDREIRWEMNDAIQRCS